MSSQVKDDEMKINIVKDEIKRVKLFNSNQINL
jgi:hypothetical protein